MIHRAALGAALALTLAAGLGCGRQEGTVQQLPSGRSYRILRAGRVKLEKTGEVVGWLVYETGKRPDDLKGIQAEAAELWDFFRPQVESAGLKGAVIQVNLPKHLFQSGDTLTGFAWERQPDGSWKEKKE